MEEDWGTLVSFFPKNWKRLGVQSGAITRSLRSFKSEEDLMRTLLIHLACGYSLRETVVRAKTAKIADVSDVALLKRLRSCKEWFYEMCLALMAEQGIQIPTSGIKCRLFDATTVNEPGKTGSLWRIHYSVRIPTFCCDFLEITTAEGKGTGETLNRFPISEDDYIIADRGYSHPNGVKHVNDQKAYLLVRLNPYQMPLFEVDGRPLFLLKYLKQIKKTGTIKGWRAFVRNSDGELIAGRVCVVRKTEIAIKLAQKKAIRFAKKRGNKMRGTTLEYAKYVMVFTTFPKTEFTCREILKWYRVRWQIELVFKKFKSLAQLGHLPKRDDDSSKAWLYGKLFVALITQKLINHANFFSPWGYPLEKISNPKQLARLRFYASSSTKSS